MLDMRTGTTFNEVYEEEGGDVDVFGRVIGWFPRRDGSAPRDTYRYLADLPADRDHGGAFDYRTPLTSMLGWLCERASGERLAPLISRELWSPMGAEFEASLAVDAIGTGFVGGGFNATAARSWPGSGSCGVEVAACPTVPNWCQPSGCEDTLAGGPDSVQARRDAPEFEPDPDYPDAFYRNKWWIYDPERSVVLRDRHPRSVRDDRRSGRSGRGTVLEPGRTPTSEPDEYAHMALVRRSPMPSSG